MNYLCDVNFKKYVSFQFQRDMRYQSHRDLCMKYKINNIL